MAFLRQGASGNYSLVFKWKGKSYIKALGTEDLGEAKQIKQDTEDQLARIRKGEREHVRKLPKRCRVMCPIFEDFNYSGGNKRWKGKSKRSAEQRRCDKADRLFEKLVKGTDFERLDGYHALRHSFISILVA